MTPARIRLNLSPLRAARLRASARLALVLIGAAVLSGCAGMLRVDNQVQSFATWSAGASPSGTAAGTAPAAVPAAPQSFRFERLPSQQDSRSAGAQDELESLARTALAKVGWTPVDATAEAPWRVQVSASTQRLPRAPWEDPWSGPWGNPFWGDPWGRSSIGFGLYGGRGTYFGAGGQIFFAPAFVHMESPYYLREVSLVIRSADTGRVVYETRAAHDGRWNSTPALWGAMLDAALQGFPTPPAGVRQVDVDIAR